MEANMLEERSPQSLTDREITIAFNMGLRAAVFLLEEAENLSPRGRNCLLAALKKEIEDSDVR